MRRYFAVFFSVIAIYGLGAFVGYGYGRAQFVPFPLVEVAAFGDGTVLWSNHKLKRSNEEQWGVNVTDNIRWQKVNFYLDNKTEFEIKRKTPCPTQLGGQSESSSQP
jgi:hypothetical protein